jgi:hypothetical protein
MISGGAGYTDLAGKFPSAFAAHDLHQGCLRPCCHTLDCNLKQNLSTLERCPLRIV